MLELLKVIVQPVVLERDPDGRIVGERLSEPQPLYTLDDLTRFVEQLQTNIDVQNRSNGNGNGGSPLLPGPHLPGAA